MSDFAFHQSFPFFSLTKGLATLFRTKMVVSSSWLSLLMLVIILLSGEHVCWLFLRGIGRSRRL